MNNMYILESYMDRCAEDLERLEICMKDLKLDKDNDYILKQMQRILVRLFNQDFVLDVCNNETSQFFGITVFPSEETCDSLVSSILVNKSKYDMVEDIWKNNNVWYIEIDSLILKDISINTNPRELVAVLLNQIGYTIYSNAIPQRIFNILRYELTNITLRNRVMLENNKFRKLINLVVLQACSDNYYKKLSEDESDVDKFVERLGYSDDLETYLNKLMMSQGTSSFGDKRDLDSNVSIVLKWALENINELHKRKTKLRAELNSQIIQTPSMYTKRFVKGIKDIFFGKETGEKYKKILIETALDNMYKSEVRKSEQRVLLEYTSGPRNKVNGIDILDIDYIRTQINEVKNHADKLFVMELISDLEERINYSIETIESGKQHLVPDSKLTLTRYLEELSDMRSELINAKVEDLISGVIIKSPEWLKM